MSLGENLTWTLLSNFRVISLSYEKTSALSYEKTSAVFEIISTHAVKRVH